LTAPGSAPVSYATVRTAPTPADDEYVVLAFGPASLRPPGSLLSRSHFDRTATGAATEATAIVPGPVGLSQYIHLHASYHIDDNQMIINHQLQRLCATLWVRKFAERLRLCFRTVKLLRARRHRLQLDRVRQAHEPRHHVAVPRRYQLRFECLAALVCLLLKELHQLLVRTLRLVL